MHDNTQALSPAQRQDELAALLARALLRLHTKAALAGTSPTPGDSPASFSIVGNCDPALRFTATSPFMDTTVSATETHRDDKENRS